MISKIVKCRITCVGRIYLWLREETFDRKDEEQTVVNYCSNSSLSSLSSNLTEPNQTQIKKLEMNTTKSLI